MRAFSNAQTIVFEGLCPEFAHIVDIQTMFASVDIELLH